MSDYTATYSPDDNKLRLYAASRLPKDEYDRVRAAGFIWAAKQGLFVAPMWTPNRADLCLELAGEIGDEDTSLTDRAEERAERFSEYRENRTEDAQHAHAAVDRIAQGIPLGQPILVGHHSERHARKDAQRIENGMRKALKLWETAEYWKHRAAGAIRHAKYKERPDVRARRIKTIEADKRKQERARDEAAKWIRAWSKLTAPAKADEIRPGVVAMDAQPASEETQHKRALMFANYGHVQLAEGDPRGWSLWSALEDKKITPREAQLYSLKAHARTIARARRWIEHYTFRLTYERAMLEEAGATHLLAPKPKSFKATLPLCNYRAPEGITVGRLDGWSAPATYGQHDMTAAEYAKIHTDYKGTRVVGNSHRVRIAIVRSAMVCVFLTDSKIHDRPADVDPVLPEPPKPRAFKPREKTEAEIKIEQLREGVKAGVHVVSAPQLFPTPAPIASRMADLADLQPGLCVLEPSAGTGNLVAEVLKRVDTEVLAYEINSELCKQLAQKWPSYKLQVRRADFLDVTEFEGCYPRILMNPPFTNGSDIKHIQHARRFLAPGGVLVSVCANGPRQREQLMPEADAWIDLPSGSFSDQGTDVNTAIVVLRKERD